jgi:hypothetical protein
MFSTGLLRKNKYFHKFFSEIKKNTTANKFKKRDPDGQETKGDNKNDFSNFKLFSKNNPNENEKVNSQNSNSIESEQVNTNIQAKAESSNSKHNLDQIIKEEEEESASEKYKEFTKNLKTQDAIRRKEDIEITKVLKNPKVSYISLRSVLMQRNFLKKRNFDSESTENKKVERQVNNFEVNLKTLEKFNINFKEPITLYELDVESVEILRKSRPLFTTYFILSALSNLIFTFSFDALFIYTKYIYGTCYVSNSCALITYLISKKIKNRVLTLEYIHDEKSVKIRKWKSIWGGNAIEEIRIPIEELEMVYSKKFLEQGVSLRFKNNKNKYFWIGVAEEGLWHNMELFENIFGKVQEYEI